MESWLAGWMRGGLCISFALLVPGILTLSLPAAAAAAPEVEMTGFTILQETFQLKVLKSSERSVEKVKISPITNADNKDRGDTSS